MKFSTQYNVQCIHSTLLLVKIHVPVPPTVVHVNINYTYNILNNYIGTNVQLARKDMDVNGHERLSNITLKTQNQVKEQHF